MPSFVNALLFQLTWFGCVLGGATGQPWWGLLMLGALLLFSVSRGTIVLDLKIAMWLVPAGWLLELVWIEWGVLRYPEAGVPLWIVLLWVGVALTVNHSLAWFQRYPLCGAALAAVSAPLCYLGGERLAAVEVPSPLALALVSVAWFGLFMALFFLVPRRLRSVGRVAPLGP